MLENPPTVTQADWRARVQGALVFVRTDAGGSIEKIAMCRAKGAKIGDFELRLKKTTDFIEVLIKDGKALVVSGQKDTVEDITIRGKPIW
jgi:hypothetical protein